MIMNEWINELFQDLMISLGDGLYQLYHHMNQTQQKPADKSILQVRIDIFFLVYCQFIVRARFRIDENCESDEGH